MTDRLDAERIAESVLPSLRPLLRQRVLLCQTRRQAQHTRVRLVRRMPGGIGGSA